MEELGDIDTSTGERLRQRDLALILERLVLMLVLMVGVLGDRVRVSLVRSVDRWVTRLSSMSLGV
jgi:hypothetical protein